MNGPYGLLWKSMESWVKLVNMGPAIVPGARGKGWSLLKTSQRRSASEKRSVDAPDVRQDTLLTSKVRRSHPA